MRKLFWFNLITLDGYFEGPNREIDWHNVDDEFNELAIKQLKSIDLLLFGRVTYELMASYWPAEASMRDDPIVADKMNSISKIVFSKTLGGANWENTKLIRGNAETEILKLKEEEGKEIGIFGSAELASTLIGKNLIDEYRIMVNPVILGKGKPLFKEVDKKYPLKLINSKIFNSGNVLLYYKPVS